MDSKRKANAATSASAEGDDRASKRRKLPDGNASNASAESATHIGLTFMEMLKQARDKRNRLVSRNFLSLPDKKQMPEYYKAISDPIAIDAIEARLDRKGYQTLTDFENDVKRMFLNAKSYNQRGSEIWDDAERIRKMLSNFMAKQKPTNGEGLDGVVETAPADNADGNESESRLRRKANPERQTPSKPVNGRRTAAAPVSRYEVGTAEDFNGKTFQEAQEMIVADLINLKDDDEIEVSSPFWNRPSRQLKDYYAVIKKPASLRDVQKRIRGAHGKDDSAGVTEFKSWNSFDEAVGLIWKNAQQYNEDGSELFVLAGDLEDLFKRRLSQAKKLVKEPGPRVKLNMPSMKSPEPSRPSIKLRVGGAKASPAPAATATPSAPSPIVSNTSLTSVENGGAKSQKKQAEANGKENESETPAPAAAEQPPRRNSKTASDRPASSAASKSIPAPEQFSHEPKRKSSAASPSQTAAAVKDETPVAQSPAFVAARPTSSGIDARRDSQSSNAAVQSPHLTANPMPPPASVTPRLASASPHPQAAQAPHHPPLQTHITPGGFSVFRQPGKDASDALLPNLSVFTHPELKLARHFHLDIKPSETLTQQSITLSLPVSHYCLQMVPTLAPGLKNRQHKIFVTQGTTRMNPVIMPPGHPDKRQLYQLPLTPGIVNRIEVEVIACPARGGPKVGPGPDLEMEKVTIYVNLMKP
ncbi:MAG: hypothetical protein M1819_001900 [Sarea resinae]|nr:MAG: hypothetical protein M1819_001900 [Sarea resinae]